MMMSARAVAANAVPEPAIEPGVIEIRSSVVLTVAVK
jgi:hypothetical protein